ncbi:hypothetical protein LXL04_012896 [Taraxacum kok-saghyz]
MLWIFHLVTTRVSYKDETGEPLPFIFTIGSGKLGDCNLKDVIRDQKPWLESVLHKTDVILFRGFSSVSSASDLNDVVEAFDYEELPYVGGAAPLTNVVGRVFTSNESPPDKKIPFHHEMEQVPTFPLKVFFFCEVEPKIGGETPIVLSHVVYDKMKQKYPEFVDRLEQQGLIYTRVLGEDDDPSSPIGRGWLREDVKTGVYVENLTECEVHTVGTNGSDYINNCWIDLYAAFCCS